MFENVDKDPGGCRLIDITKNVKYSIYDVHEKAKHDYFKHN